MEEKGEIGIASIHAALARRPTPTDALSWRDVSGKAAGQNSDAQLNL